jgi:uncharacterized protein YndB with AHSA1/START domain
MSDLGTLVDSRTVRFERRVSGPIGIVWAYLTQDQYLKTWLGSGIVEQKVGGRVEIHNDGPPITGEVLRCEAPRMLSYTWMVRMPDTGAPSPESVVTFELAPTDGQVRLTLTHRPILPDFVTRTLGGWHTLLAILEARLASEEPEPFMTIFERAHPEYERMYGNG